LHGLFLGPHARLVRNERIPVDSVRRHHDVVVVASLAALVGLAPIVGAFAAGVVLEEVHYQPFLERGERKVSEQLCEPLVCSWHVMRRDVGIPRSTTSTLSMIVTD
jgi:hypothetical protein